MIPAAKLAAEALRKARQELVGFYTNSGVVFVASSVLDGIDDALAALSAEQSTVPEDRERLANDLESNIAADIIYGLGHPTREDRQVFARHVARAAAAIRQPVTGETK